jgi:O-acetyl-ADP-ribose deacetylase (regulator of RNase III)
VYRGDITDEDSDAIVNAANEGLDHGAGVAKTIVSKGGTSIQDECTRIVNTKGKLKIGEAKVSHSGDLKCKMIIHAVGPNWKDDNGENGKALLKKACQESLHQAQKYSFKSIAFPAISSGIYGMPKKICAQVMFDVAEEYSKNYTSQSGFGLVADIRFVNNDVKTVNIFKREFKARYSHGKQMEEHTQYVVTPADPSVRRFGDDLKRTSNDLPRISRTWRVENSNTVKTKEIKSESTGRSERPSTDKQPSTSDSQANSRNQGNWESYSYGDERPKHRSIHSSPDKQESMYQSQTRSYKVSHILPDKQESTSQTHPRNQRIVKSYSFSGARPKQRSVYEEMIQAEHQPLSSSNKSLKGNDLTLYIEVITLKAA